MYIAAQATSRYLLQMILQDGTLRFRQRRQTVVAQRARRRYLIAIQVHQPDIVGHLEVLLVQ